MLTSFKLFEELKRKSPKGFIVDFEKDDNGFTKDETYILQQDEFEINDNVATNVEDVCSFEITKIYSDELITYQLIIKDEDGNVLHNKKFKIDQYNNTGRVNLLNTILNVCAFTRDKIINDRHKDIDPYSEEKWDDEEKKIVSTEVANDMIDRNRINAGFHFAAARRQQLENERIARNNERAERRRQAMIDQINDEMELVNAMKANKRNKLLQKFKNWRAKPKPPEDAPDIVW